MNRTISVWTAAGLLGLALTAPVPAASPEWAVKSAPIRFVVDLTDHPSHPSAGYFMTIPDGGILPGPAPDPRVFDEAGNPLKSGVLWYNRSTGVSLVFETPKTGNTVTLYVAGVDKPKLWTPESGLTPSAILCARPGAGSRDEAFRLADFGGVGAQVQYRNQGRESGKWKQEDISLPLWDKAFGRPGCSALYMLAYVDVSDPGSTWMAPLSREGTLEAAIDGKLIHPIKINEKRGGVGAHVNMTAGLHRLDLYGFNSGGGGVGPMMFTWRTPKTTVADLGGPRAKDLRYPGSPMCETRLLKEGEIVQSGRGEVREAQARDGGPVAMFSLTCDNTFWLGDEEPLLQYTLQARTKSNPADTKYTWHFASFPGAAPAGPSVSWLFPGNKDHFVTLTAEADGKRSEAVVPFLSMARVQSSLDSMTTRTAFRRTCLVMLKAFPETVDPVAKWEASLWSNFFRTLDIEKDNPLIEYVVTKRWDAFKKKLNPERKTLLEDAFLFSLEARKPKEAMEWAMEFGKDSPAATRAVELQLKRAEILMYYLKDLKGARDVITPLLSAGGEAGEWARIRMGDLEFLSRNLNEATQRYGEVQGRSKHGVPDAVSESHTPAHTGLSGSTKPFGFAKRKAPKLESRAVGGMEPPSAVADWKMGAIRDVAVAETVATLIDQEFYLEAFQSLKSWERASPMSKITGDFILKEGKLYMALKDYARARAVLSAYCDQVDTSNFLPDALKMIVTCMIYMNEPEAAVEKYEKEIKKRMEAGGGGEL